MKVIKNPLPLEGTCTICKTEYLIHPKELKKAFISVTGSVWMTCKFCNQLNVKVVTN